MNKSILDQAKQIARIGGEKNLVKAQEMLLGFLKNDPQNTTGWLLLARIEYNSPLEDQFKILEYCNNILSYDSDNAYALLILAETYNIFFDGMPSEIFAQLSQAKSGDPEIQAMIELAKARYYKNKNEKMYINALRRSVGLSPNQQTNSFELGLYLLQHGNIVEGHYLIDQAIKNIKKIDAEYDATSIEGWFDYYYKGIEIPRWLYNDRLMILQKATDILHQYQYPKE